MSDQTALSYTPLEEIKQIHVQLRATHLSGKLRPIKYRKNQILQLAYLFDENKDAFAQAYAQDLGRNPTELALTEINRLIDECVSAVKQVDSWVQPQSGDLDLVFAPMSPTIHHVPKGVVLIIGPFNYPLLCSVAIMVGAIAAGCPCVVKMSEQVPHVSALTTELFSKYLDPACYRIVNGAIPEMEALLDLEWDHIMFTGSATVGKIVASAAAKNLTPTTLELGGQSPVFVDPRVNLDIAARRILWGKTLNAGQVCLSPNHIFVPEKGQDALIEALKRQHQSFYPEGVELSDCYSRIVNERAFDRLTALLERTKGEIVLGGQFDGANRYIAPTVVKDVGADDALLEGEIFGPILPIVPVKDFQEAIDFTNSRGHPLALYVFSNDNKLKAKIFRNTQSGTVMYNDNCMSMTAPGLPFGGHGRSGYGSHREKYSFETFSHKRTTLDVPYYLEPLIKLRAPPFTNIKTFLSGLLMDHHIPYVRPGPGRVPVTQLQRTKKWLIRRWVSLVVILVFAIVVRRSEHLKALVPRLIFHLGRLRHS